MTNSNIEIRFNRLVRKLKIHRISLFFILFGVFLLYFANTGFTEHLVEVREWLKLAGGTLVVAGIVTLTYEFVVREETLSQIIEGVREELKNSMNEMDSKIKQCLATYIADALLLNKDVQKQILDKEKLNEVMEVCLSTRLGEGLAKELLKGVIQPTLNAFISTTQRVMQDYDLNIQLEETGDPDIRSEFYLLHLTVEYRYVLKTPQLKFVCATSRRDFQVFLDDPTVTYVYLLPDSKLSQIRFDVPIVHLQSGGNRIPIKRKDEEGMTTESGAIKVITFDSFELAQYVGNECKLFYKILTIIRKDGHMYFMKIKHPIKNLRVTFDSGNTAITNVSVSDSIVSSGGMMVQEPTIGDRKIVTVSVDGWVFPNSGVTFVWHSRS